MSSNLKYRLTTAFVLGMPILGFLVALYLAFSGEARPSDIGLAVIYFFLGGFGITVGFHRYATHESFQTTTPIKIALLVLGSMTWAGPVDWWVTNHRKHHHYADQVGDPHSPWEGFPHTLIGLFTGLFHSHVGWLLRPGIDDRAKYAPRLLDDPIVRIISKIFPLWSILAIAIPLVLQGWNGVWWALTAIFIRHNVMWAVNSFCHVWGSQPFRTSDHSTNNWVIALFGLGEGWHNNHHAFQWSAFHGLRWWEFDLSAFVICWLAYHHFVWNVQIPDQAMIMRKLAVNTA